MKKQKLSTWRTAGKKVKIRDENNTVEVSVDRNLIARGEHRQESVCENDGGMQKSTGH